MWKLCGSIFNGELIFLQVLQKCFCNGKGRKMNSNHLLERRRNLKLVGISKSENYYLQNTNSILILPKLSPSIWLLFQLLYNPSLRSLLSQFVFLSCTSPTHHAYHWRDITNNDAENAFPIQKSENDSCNCKCCSVQFLFSSESGFTTEMHGKFFAGMPALSLSWYEQASWNNFTK